MRKTPLIQDSMADGENKVNFKEHENMILNYLNKNDCKYIRMCTYIHICIYAHMHICIDPHMHIYIYILYVCTLIYIFAFKHICLDAYLHISTYTYT